MRQAAIFAWRKKKLIKQDALKAHAQSGFQETTRHIRDTAKAAHTEQHTTMNGRFRCRNISNSRIHHPVAV